ncbi:hypothetical protein ACHAXA_010280 [Cyclostephanos tholiformis]|uniref:MYND-type domain-containing protein n=1 Tax=Cyclostephanos tholiformis TaxID=382380 RepID=A0ABD3RE09_9STRA
MLTRFSNNKIRRKKSFDDLSARSNSIASSVDAGSEVDPVVVSASVLPGDGDKNTGIVAETEPVRNLGKKPGILRVKMGQRAEVATTQALPQHYQQQYPQGYPLPGFPPGMMPMQPGTLPPGMMPYMMPSYNDWSNAYRGTCYDYSCGHPEIQSVDVDYGEGCDYSYDTTCNSSRTTMLCAEGLANVVLKTVDSVANSVNDVLNCGADVVDYGEELLCDHVRSRGNSGGTRRSTSMLASRSAPQDNAEYLNRIDKPYKLVTEKAASGEAKQEKKHLNPLEALNESAITHRSVTGLIGVDDLESFSADAEDKAPVKVETIAIEGGDNIEELTSLFSDNLLGENQKTNDALKQNESATNRAVENAVILKDPKTIMTKLRLGRSQTRIRSRSRDLMKFIPFKSCPAKEEYASIEKETDISIDSIGFPLLTSPKEWIRMFPSCERDFSSGNGYAVQCISSPVSVTASLETQICAWCGLGGSNTKDVKKLKVCSACKSTYYCNSECQSKDWINGHAKTCRRGTAL